MESKNVIAAISLSAAVIILWGLFFIPEPQKLNQIQNNDTKSQISDSKETPSLEVSEEVKGISREDAIKGGDRIIFENQNIIGSISLNGSAIDDYTFKKYNKELDSKEKIVLLNPANVENGYILNTGWATSNKNIDVPDLNTVWNVEGNNKITPENPVKLFWKNDQGLRFEKIISLDEKYLFTVNQKIINSGDKTYSFYPYGYIHRNKIPDDLTDFYILHEGFVILADDELIEKDYDEVEEKKFSKNAQDGYLSIGDKYWLTSLIPSKSRSFRIDIDYKNKYRASFIDIEGIELASNSSIENTTQLIIGAKTVRDIDGYAESNSINKFDLVINWGILYWIVKPMFYVLEYFFKYTGNFGIAIIMLTVLIRLIFFPLNNFAFKSMSKMKILQPEMTRLKELHKGDKVKLQQEMMSLYKREKINPASGCFPILLQIPFFFALYKLLLLSVEMRHEPFFGYIKDLSAKDPLSIFNLFGLIPYEVPTFLEIGLLPCLMGITMYLQQKLNPTPVNDPVQKKIFAFFPLFLTVILAPFASGLVLYWTSTNVLTIIQQWIIFKRTSVKTK